jgi:hypothetical protein
MWSYNNRNNNSRAPLCPHEGLHYPVLTPSVEPYTLHGFAAHANPTHNFLTVHSPIAGPPPSPRNTATATVTQTLTIAQIPR